MTKVSNKKVISRLAFRELRSNSRMNIVVILSIVLTCVLFTALTSISGSLINGSQQETMRQVGGDRMAGLKCVLPEDYEKVCGDSATCDVVYRVIVGNAVNDAFKNFAVEINYAGDEDAAKAAFCNPTTGKLPENYDEIAVSTLVLDALGLPHELGTVVPVTLDVDGEISEHEFKLCGYWQGEKVAMAQECWVSKVFADKFAPTPTERFNSQEYPSYAGYWQVDFNYANSWNIEGKTDALISRLYGNSENAPDVGINWAYTTSNVDSGMVVGGIVMILVIFAAGYLIIYNIFYINISANIRSYGLLKTIGTTAQQIRRMVRVQAAVYCVIGIPFGLIIGILSGKILFKAIMVIMNIYSAASYAISVKLLVMICLVSAVFTFLTVMISCGKPCKIAGSVSPIEALRYNETNIHAKKRDKKTRTISPLSVARNNMLRSRKKTFIVVLSLTLSMVLVNTLFTVLGGIDMDKYVSTQIVGDFIIMPDKVSALNYDDQHALITPEQLEYLNTIDGVRQVSPIYFRRGKLAFHEEPLERLNTLCDKYADTDKYGSLANAKENNSIPTDIYGVTDDVLNVLEPADGKIDLTKWQSGKYAIVNTYYLGAEDEKGEPLYSVGDTLTLSSMKDMDEDTTKDFEVMALCEMPYAISTQSYYLFGGQVIIPESAYFEMTDNRNAMSVMMNAEENCFDDVDKQIRYMTDRSDSQVIAKSKQTYLEEFSDLIKMIKLVGGTLSGILALIGILNFVNAVVTGIISRKRELAMMNAVGMTGSQLKKMLMWEGVHYAALTAVCSVIIGFLLDNVVVKSITGDLFFFTYHFTFMPILICVPILLLLSAVIPSVAYQTICRDSVVNRLREN